ncbi:MAG: hypothetical protein Q8R02_18980 [Hyphomonadaceae bacterium]|nr:hypothetical protein [Hyphomonadaceae bacterium]
MRIQLECQIVRCLLSCFADPSGENNVETAIILDQKIVAVEPHCNEGLNRIPRPRSFWPPEFLFCIVEADKTELGDIQLGSIPNDPAQAIRRTVDGCQGMYASHAEPPWPNRASAHSNLRLLGCQAVAKLTRIYRQNSADRKLSR